MGRTMIAALISMGMLSGCTDWREGEERVEACVQRFALKNGAVDPLDDSPHQWVPSYTYDVTELAPEALRSLIKASPTKGQTEGIWSPRAAPCRKRATTSMTGPPPRQVFC